jgi:hypothetical protein
MCNVASIPGAARCTDFAYCEIETFCCDDEFAEGGHTVWLCNGGGLVARSLVDACGARVMVGCRPPDLRKELTKDLTQCGLERSIFVVRPNRF